MLLLVFVDGVGIGPRGPHNPLDGSRYLAHFAGEPLTAPRGGRVVTVDARLDVPGLPQSATGQATLITGENAAAMLGRHQSGFARGSLLPLLRERSLFARLATRGLDVAHANVAPSSIAGRRVRTMSAIAVAAEEAGLAPRTLSDLSRGDALHHDFTNGSLIAHGLPLAPLAPDEAGRRLARISDGVDFCVFEYFGTDAAGHARNAIEAARHLSRLDAFLDALVDEIDLQRDSVVLASDHGNLEDLSTGRHTLHPVAVSAWGPVSGTIDAITSLGQVAGVIETAIAGSNKN